MAEVTPVLVSLQSIQLFVTQQGARNDSLTRLRRFFCLGRDFPAPATPERWARDACTPPSAPKGH